MAITLSTIRLLHCGLNTWQGLLKVENLLQPSKGKPHYVDEYMSSAKIECVFVLLEPIRIVHTLQIEWTLQIERGKVMN